MNNNNRLSQVEKELSSNKSLNKNVQQYNNFKAQVEVTEGLTNSKNLRDLKDEIASVVALLDKLESSGKLVGKDYKDVSNAFHNIKEDSAALNRDAKNNAEQINKIVKELSKLDGKNIDKKIAGALKKFLENSSKMVNFADDYADTMKKASKTFKEAFSDSMDAAKKTIMDLSNAFNLQKLVTGGLGIKDLRSMQGNVKISMNLDDSGFMGLQKELINQNSQIADTMGEAYVTFSDTVTYLSSIKDYSFKNYNQSVAMYKQIMIGNKYLSLSTQSLSSMVKATNQLADDSYMNRQLAIMSALGSDSGLAEDMESLAQFSASNIAGLSARYNNSSSVMQNALVMKSINDAYLGNSSQLYDNLLSEIMNANDFATLSSQTQLLLNMAGMSSEVQQMMRSGNLDVQRLMLGVNQGVYNFSQRNGGSTTLDMYGLGEWNTAANAFNNNRDAYLQSIDDQLKAISKYDLSTAEGMKQAQEALAKQNDNRTWWEKFSDNIMTSLGIQDQNWTELLGLVQMAQTLLSTFTLVTSAAQLLTQIAILKDIKKIKLSKMFGGDGGGLTGLLGNSWGASWGGSGKLSQMLGIAGKGGMSNGAALGLGAIGIGAGLAWGFSDASKMSKGEGLDMGDIRGFFLGTGGNSKSSGENAMSVVGNVGKYTAIGAGLGTIIPGVGTAIGAGIGALAGLVTGIIGTQLDDNTEATKDNTDAIQNSNDYMISKSYLNKIFKQYTMGEGGVGGADGAATIASSAVSTGTAVGTPTKSYRYGISSNYGNREYWYNGKKVKDFHKGVDFRFPQGTGVGAAQSGTVVGAAAGFNGGAGQFIRIRGVDGLDYLYYHLHKRYVNKGDKVTAGDLIALSGGNRNVDGNNAGQSTGAHLHFQVNKDGGYSSYTSPYAYVTSQLFNPGSAPTYVSGSTNTSGTEVSSSDGLTYRISKESLFSMGASNPVGQGGAINESSTANYATSSDVDRLIDVIREVNEIKNSQKELMQMLSGGNNFVYGRD